MLKRLLSIIYLFVFIFSPPLVPKINILLLLTIYSLFKILLNPKFRKLFFEDRNVYMYILYFMYILLIIGFQIIFSGTTFLSNMVVVVYRLLVLIPSMYICGCYIFMENIGREKDYLYSNIVYAGFLQSIISILAFVIPSIKISLVELMARNTGSDIYYQNTYNGQINATRFFGFSGTLLDTFGYGMALITLLATIYGVSKNKKMLIYVPFLLISTLLNSRSGLLLYVVGLGLFFLFNLKSLTLKKLILGPFVLIAGVVILFPLFNIVSKYSPATYMWINNGFQNLFNFLLGKESTNFEVTNILFSKSFWEIPNSFLSLLFGTGHNIYGGFMRDHFGFNSDVGYVNQLWIGGLIGNMLLIYVFWLYISKAFTNIKIHGESFEVQYLIIAIIVSLIMMIKGDIISYSPGSAVWTIFLMNSYFVQKKSEENILKRIGD